MIYRKFIAILLRQRALWFTLGLLCTILLVFQEEMVKGFELGGFQLLLLKTYAFTFIVIALSIPLFDYLRGSESTTGDGDYEARYRNSLTTAELRDQLSKLEDLIARTGVSTEPGKEIDAAFNQTDKDKLFDIIATTVSQNINGEFLKSLDEKYSLKLLNESKYKDIVRDFNQIRSRVVQEISSLSARANLNLVIGSVTTIIAVGILFTSVYYKSVSFSDTEGVLSYFIPRISTVVFIELFSFFFLKLYRSNLHDVKYYQNEMTNIDFKLLSLKSALLADDKEAVKEIISEFKKVERNFILKKGETTVEIETSKTQAAADKSLIDTLKVVVENQPKLKKEVE